MGYKIDNDDGRIEGSFDSLTANEVVGKFDYGKYDVKGNYEVVGNVTKTTGKEN